MRVYTLSDALRNKEKVTELVLRLRDSSAPFPPELGSLSGLTKLTVTHGAYLQLPAVLAKLPNLEKLVFQHCGLSHPGPVLRLLKHLNHLDLSGNELSAWPSDLKQLPLLRELDLSDNQLRSVPPDIGSLRSLQSLRLANNQISRLSRKIGGCSQLQSLDFTNNRLTRLPVELGQLGELRQLLLAGNRLQDLPHELGGCPYLQRLDLGNNRFQQLPAALACMPWLTQLKMGDNKLENLPPWLEKLARLERLSLGGNRLLTVPAFTALEWLRELDLRGNQLDRLSGLPRRLQVLDLKGNQFTKLPPSVAQLPHLGELDLSDNPITTLDGLDRLKKLKKITAHRTPVQLDATTLLGFPRLAEVRGLVPPSTNRQLLRFWAEFPDGTRPLEPLLQVCYRIFRKDRTVWGELTLADFCALLAVPRFWVRHPAWRALLRKYGFKGRLRRGSVVACIGRLAAGEEEIRSRLQARGVIWRDCPDEQTTHLLMGEQPECRSIPAQTVMITNEAGLTFWLDQAEGRFLARERDPEKLGQLRQLLLHDDERNVQLAFRMMAGGGLPKPLLTDAWLARSRALDKTALDRLLLPYLSVPARDRLRHSDSLTRAFHGNDKTFFRYERGMLEVLIRKMTDYTELDANRLLTYLAGYFEW